MIGLFQGAGIFENSALLATVAILIAAISLGLGIAFKNKRITDFGKEEIVQVIITLAMIGVMLSLVQGIDATVNVFFDDMINVSCNVTNNMSRSVETAMCLCGQNINYVNTLSFNIMRSQYILGYLSNIGINLDIISAQPFSALNSFVEQLNDYNSLKSAALSLLWFEQLSLGLILSLAVTVFFPLGLFLRLFFPTRRLGAILIAIGVSFYTVFPLVLLITAPHESLPKEIPFEKFNQRYGFLPQTDLNRQTELLDTINNISMTNTEEDIVSQASLEMRKTEEVLNRLTFHTMISVALALLTSVVFAWELFRLLGSPMIATWYYV